MALQETDYLVVGSGASGLAFADTLLTETDAHITIVDRHAKPGGHWNDAYPFVALHQPSSFYGVNSLELGSGHKDSYGVNQGMYELASGPEIAGYFHKVMTQKLLPSGRVRYIPLCNYLGQSESGGAQLQSILSGDSNEVLVRKKLVDAHYAGPRVPSTQAPRFPVAQGVHLVPPNALVNLWQQPDKRPRHFVILGAGKTAMDVGVWLLGCGAPPDAISWVMPRDSWLLNRATTQPGLEFFNAAIGGQAAQMQALAQAQSVDDLFARLEAGGQMLRIDPNHKPTMFHYATISVGEVEQLRRIKKVIRMGRVQAIDATGMTLDAGHVAAQAGTLYIDCTASAVEPRPDSPIFQGKKIVLQLLLAPLPTFSAALTAYVEAHFDAGDEDNARKNQLCTTVPFPHDLAGYARATMVTTMNQFQWSQDKALRNWVRGSRLNGLSKMVASVDRGDAEKMALLAAVQNNSVAALANIPKLLAQSVLT